jgi:hypothetical protein
MKSLSTLPIAFAVLMFSGCYTQLMVEDDDPWATEEQPEYPEPPAPIIIIQPVYPPPRPPHGPPPIVPGPAPALPPPVINPGGTSGNQDTHRDTGYERRGSTVPQQNSQDDTRSSGVNRGGDHLNSPQYSQPVSQTGVPSRENSVSPSPSPQPSTQGNSTSGRRR